MKRLMIMVGLVTTLCMSIVWAAPIHIVALTGNLEEVKRLISEDPDQVGLQNNYDWTALHIAAFKGFKGIAQVLVGTNPNLLGMRDSKGKTAADIARESGYEELAQRLNPGRMAKGAM